MPGPLQGVKIIEMTSVVLGPWACQMLADMGAEVDQDRAAARRQQPHARGRRRTRAWRRCT
jgi:crotonobetainyl-CoA:carnitine CoA-transferase CaiB-like acyl-CoA transferase